MFHELKPANKKRTAAKAELLSKNLRIIDS